ncbi:hypothetical protein [uncultured Jannaschia sp.]|uniref:hypothetical protein n=1 Tax=uncultured Jannaschia sp. TaxID=293347 RepID=UPI002616F3FA|nr:hypothetical protein [uncultured Jannaschia sp.]
MMVGTDFAAALLCVLYPGPTTDVAEAVDTYWSLPLALLEVDDPGRTKPVQFGPKDALSDEVAAYFARYKLGLTHGRHPFDGPENLVGVLTCMFTDYSPRNDHDPSDRITLTVCGERLSIVIELHGRSAFAEDGHPIWFDEEAGPEYATVRLTFGALIHPRGRSLLTERTLWGDALNDLAKVGAA